MATKDQQVREVVEGLGLGLVALGTTKVPSSKLDLEFAFSHAWRRWDSSSQYPSIGRAAKPDNVFHLGVVRSHRRNTAAVVWRDLGTYYEIAFKHEYWSPAEVAGLLGDRPVREWTAFAKPFWERLTSL